jgi:hypothetical protein
MESPFYLHPAFVGLAVSTLITFISSTVAFVVWLVRMESKLATLQEKNLKLEIEVAELWKELIEHREKVDIHFDRAHSRTVQDNNDKQFARIEDELREIKRMIQGLTHK